MPRPAYGRKPRQAARNDHRDLGSRSKSRSRSPGHGSLAHSNARRKIPPREQALEHLAKSVAKKAIGTLPPDNSDDSDRVVTTRSSQARGRKRQEVYASGGLGQGDQAGSYPNKRRRSASLRRDTEEILVRRSQSNSRATSPEKESAQKSAERPVQEADSAVKSVSKLKRRSNGAIQPLSTKNIPSKTATIPSGRADAPPAVKVSILGGSFKPRARQHSILHALENEESTILNSDDENQFLPDDTGTPVPQNREGPVSSISASIQFPSSNPSGARRLPSKKRKRGSDEATIEHQTDQVIDTSQLQEQDEQQQTGRVVHSLSPEIAEPTRTQKQKMSTSTKHTDQEQDVMRPPESSDLEDEPEQISPAKSKKSVQARKELNSISTNQLQSLLPSKRVRRNLNPDPYDIPGSQQADSSNDELSDNHSELSAFAKTGRKGNPSKKASAKTKMKPPGKKGSKAKPQVLRDKDASTPAPPSPAQLRATRTPLPLSSRSARNGAGVAILSSPTKSMGAQAKTPSKQAPRTRTALGTLSTNINTARTRTSPPPQKQPQKRYGGRHHPTSRDATNEENRLGGGSELSTVPTDSYSPALNSQNVRNNNDEDDNRSPAKRRKTTASTMMKNKIKGKDVGPEIKAWKDKWADIDDYVMDVEVDSASMNGSSQIDAR